MGRRLMATGPTHGGAEACDYLRRRAQERLDAGDRLGARVLFEEVVRVAPSDAVYRCAWRRYLEQTG